MAIWRIASLIIGGFTLAVFAGGANYWNQDYGWYKSLNAPTWQPPDFVFGIIWPYNFIVIGIALYTIISQARFSISTTAIFIFGTSVFFALRWSYLFYSVHNFSGSASALLIAAILTLPLLAITYSYSWKAAIALVPYQIWIFTAAALARGYSQLN